MKKGFYIIMIILLGLLLNLLFMPENLNETIEDKKLKDRINSWKIVK